MQLVLSDAALAMSRRTSVHCFGFAKRATVAKLHSIATALLQLLLLEPTHAADSDIRTSAVLPRSIQA